MLVIKISNYVLSIVHCSEALGVGLILRRSFEKENEGKIVRIRWPELSEKSVKMCSKC